MENTAPPSPAFSIPSILALVLAIAAFAVTPGRALFAAIGAIVFGAIGVAISILPMKRGGIISFMSLLLGALGVIAAIVRLVMSSSSTATY